LPGTSGYSNLTSRNSIAINATFVIFLNSVLPAANDTLYHFVMREQIWVAIEMLAKTGYRKFSLRTLLVLTLLIVNTSVVTGSSNTSNEKHSDDSAKYTTIGWTDLIPKADLEALLNPPKSVTEIEDGSLEDQINSKIQNANSDAIDDRYQQALMSTSVVAEMDGESVRIPGFIVPLEFLDDQTTTEFFLVPYFGACIHSPPPPPNQIIFVKYAKGLKLEALYNAYWISGVLKTSLEENYLGTSAYELDMKQFENYSE